MTLFQDMPGTGSRRVRNRVQKGPEQPGTGSKGAKYSPSEAQWSPRTLSNGDLDLSNTCPW